ncbi:MAG TPA: efflux RND transporter periplasmic adaptor subunit [Dokdonella sp.]|uniref:efflux RND transporter periplasmic adaptor subunit n=1 Tax=Dokdonella sp. TaxID=2291710 RepID=UPI002D7FD711|nr:efflux RND transporter periplasmic adaptor subunit [Dokdonella sp.]HET9034288.1 efflux RND transporter periplasmic adaptor subunit [Dokdonella sp.]
MLPLPVCRPILGATLIALLASCGAKPEVAEAPRVARVAQVETANDKGVSVYPGEVRARYESALGFRVGGKIKARLVDVGNHVDKGQVLAELDPRDLELASSSARATLASAQAAFRLAESEHQRYQTLHAQNFVSQINLEAKANALEAARAHVTEAQAALNAATNQTGYADLRADADGVITTVLAEAGQVVGTGQTVLNLAHDGASEVEINVPEQAISGMRIGSEAQVELWTDSGNRSSGRVREIAPAADATTRTFRVRVAFDDESSKPRLGQSARVYFFASNNAQGRFIVPLSAVYEKEGKAALWQFDTATRKVHLTPVVVDKFDETVAFISEGLVVQTWIVTAGVHRLREGEVVSPIDAQNRRVSF